MDHSNISQVLEIKNKRKVLRLKLHQGLAVETLPELYKVHESESRLKNDRNLPEKLCSCDL